MPAYLKNLSDSKAITVSALNQRVRKMIEQGVPLLWVAGEISNLTLAASGHWYFALKDERAQVRCVMFRQKNRIVDWAPQDGAAVEVQALATLYEPRGDYQLTVEVMRRSGLGALYEAFEKLKTRLEREGLFDPTRKRTLPRFPRSIGIITSPAGAALRDVLTTLRRRSPNISIIIYPTQVQGEGAAVKIAAALDAAGRRGECDVLILCRGGGSIEDLWPFNEEIVARSIVACTLPIVCGVGHETDFTIADFAADHRAATPTAAAELASPSQLELSRDVAGWRDRLFRIQGRMLESRMVHLDHLARRLLHPGARLANEQSRLAHLDIRLRQNWTYYADAQGWQIHRIALKLNASKPDTGALAVRQAESRARLKAAMRRRLEIAAAHADALKVHLKHLNPVSVLTRGFSVVRTATGAIVRSHTQVAPDDPVAITFAEGQAEARISESKK